jgi:hypothetical protein
MSLTSPSKYVASEASAVRERSRPATAAASSDSATVHRRERAISASTCARPPIPLCMPSRSQLGSVASGLTGIQTPASSYRTWSSTHRHAASARSRWRSAVVTR